MRTKSNLWSGIYFVKESFNRNLWNLKKESREETRFRRVGESVITIVLTGATIS